MGARWYDARIGRWISADTIVPDPANPQSLNRFAYVLGNPLKFTDPTGHFDEETQLEKWFGDDWRSQFSEVWQARLLRAEFGDAVVYGLDGDTPQFFVLVEGADGSLVGWNTDPSIAYVGAEQVQTLLSRTSVPEEKMGIYRSRYADDGRGPSDNLETDSFWDNVNAPFQYQHVLGYMLYGDRINLPKDWNTVPGSSYIGSHYHVETEHHWAGCSPSEFDYAGLGIAMATAKGGTVPGIAFGLVVAFADMSVWDTSFRVTPNAPTPSRVPAASSPHLPTPTP